MTSTFRIPFDLGDWRVVEREHGTCSRTCSDRPTVRMTTNGEEQNRRCRYVGTMCDRYYSIDVL